MSYTKEITPLVIAKWWLSLLLIVSFLLWFYPYEVKAADQWINIEINPSYVDADLTDYPVYIDLSDLPAAFWNTTNCTDIRAFKSDGTTELAREIVSCSDAGSSGTGELHVKYTGTLSSSATTTIQIHYDGSSSDYATTDTYGRNNVWSAYKTVLHMDDSSGNATDSSGNATWLDNATVGTGSGKIGNARDFVRANSEHFDTTAEMLDGMSEATISMWFNRDTNTDPQFLWSFEREFNANDAYANWTILGDSSNNDANFGFEDLSSTRVFFDSTNSFNTGTWYLAHFTWDGSTMRQYKDGVANGTAAASGFGTFGDTSTDKFIGGNDAVSIRYYDGLIDEFRVIQTFLGADWYDAEYNNQSSPDTFYWVSGEQTAGGGGVGEEYTIIFF